MRRSDLLGGYVYRIDHDLTTGVDAMAADLIAGLELRLLAEWHVDQMDKEGE